MFCMYVHIKSSRVYSFVFILPIFHWGNIIKMLKMGGFINDRQKEWKRVDDVAVGLSVEGGQIFCT